MSTISTSGQLRQRIAELETLRYRQEADLKEQLNQTMEALKPGNMISQVFHKPEVKDSLVGATIGLVTGYLSKRLLLGPAAGPVSKVAGDVLQWGVAAISGSKADTIKEKIGNFLRKRKFR